MGEDSRYSEYVNMVIKSRKAQKEFISSITKEKTALLPSDNKYYEAIQHESVRLLTILNFSAFGFIIYWLRKLDFAVENKTRVRACILLIGLLPVYIYRLKYTESTPKKYEEFLYAKYVLIKSKT